MTAGPIDIDCPGMFIPTAVLAELYLRLDVGDLFYDLRKRDDPADRVLLETVIRWHARVVSHLADAPSPQPTSDVGRPASDVVPLCNVMSTTQAADELGIDPRNVIRAAEKGRLTGRQLDRFWVFDRDDVAEFKRQRS